MYHYVLVFLFLGCNHRLQKIGCNHFLPKTENEEADHTANFETVTVKSKRVKLARAWPRVSQPPRRRLRPHRHPNHSAATLSPAPTPAAAGPKPARRSTPRRRTPHPNLCAAILTGLPRHPNLPRHPILRRHPNLRRQVNLSRRPNVCGAMHPSHPHPTCALGPLALCYLPRRQRDANAKRVDPSGEVL